MPVSVAAKKKDDFYLYPNPVPRNARRLYFNSPLSFAGTSIWYDITGKAIHSQGLEHGQKSLTLSTLSSGMYILTLFGYGGEMVSSQKVLFQ